jgi:hypothetical protein
MSLTKIPLEFRLEATERFYKFQEKTNGMDWVEILNEIEKNPDFGIPETLVLLNPKHHKELGATDPRGDRTFPKTPSGFPCRSNEIWGYECPFKSPNIHVDHMFPYSKGGATHSQNAMHLCAEHNLIKHSDIHWIPWEKLPDNNEWIITSLKVLFNFAARNSSLKIYFPEKQVRKI